MTKAREEAPERVNREQEDEDAQAQTIAAEALARSERAIGAEDSEKVASIDAQDLVDHMNQMVSSGLIDMSAFHGERNDDDEGDDDDDEPDEEGEFLRDGE